MELLLKHTNGYILEPSIDSLHKENLHWLEEIKFWKEELIFFYKLLHKKEGDKSFPPTEIAGIEKELVRIDCEELDELHHMVSDQERSIALLFKSNLMVEETECRKTHRILFFKMVNLSNKVRKFKQDVFALIERQY